MDKEGSAFWGTFLLLAEKHRLGYMVIICLAVGVFTWGVFSGNIFLAASVSAGLFLVWLLFRELLGFRKAYKNYDAVREGWRIFVGKLGFQYDTTSATWKFQTLDLADARNFEEKLADLGSSLSRLHGVSFVGPTYVRDRIENPELGYKDGKT